MLWASISSHTVRLWAMSVGTFTLYDFLLLLPLFFCYSNVILKVSSLNWWILYKGIFFKSCKRFLIRNVKEKWGRSEWVFLVWFFLCVSLFDLHPFWVISHCVPSKFCYSARYYNCLLQIFLNKLFMSKIKHFGKYYFFCLTLWWHKFKVVYTRLKRLRSQQ